MLLNPETVSVERRGELSVVAGELVFAASTFFDVVGDLQPDGGRSTEHLPEGFRTRGRVKMYSSADLRTVNVDDTTKCDRVTVSKNNKPRVFDVVIKKDFSTGLFGTEHFKYILVEIRSDERG